MRMRSLRRVYVKVRCGRLIDRSTARLQRHARAQAASSHAVVANNLQWDFGRTHLPYI